MRRAHDPTGAAHPQRNDEGMASTETQNAPAEVLHLEVVREAERIKICLAAQRSGEMQTVRHIEELKVSAGHIRDRCLRMIGTLNQANRQGHMSAEMLARLKEAGQLFRDDLFSAHIKSQFNASGADQLIVALDDQLVHIPWELLHDGEQFLGQRFAMGRVVRTRQSIIGRAARCVAPPVQVLVVADPCADLASAYAEGIAIRDLMDAFQSHLWVSFRSQGVNPDFIKSKIRHYDWVHFAGHADHDHRKPENSGWRLSHARLTAADIMKMAGTGAMPALVFSNACQSARTDSWDVGPDVQDRIFGLANAFLLAGVKHYVGTLWEVPDESSLRFALAFYRYLLSGRSVGDALRCARRASIRFYGEENIVWASYLLYGDPSTVYLKPGALETQAAPSGAQMPAPPADPIGTALRTPEEVIELASPTSGPRSKKPFLVGLVLAALCLIAFAAAMIPTARDVMGRRSEQQALAAFKNGRYDQVERICRRMQNEAPQRSLSHLLLGNLFFLRGRLETARRLYQDALQAKRGSAQDKAEALIGLGRIASESDQPDLAIQYYRQAADMAPGSQTPYLAQALVLERRGELRQAPALLRQAKTGEHAADSILMDALADRMETAIAAAEPDRQTRIDRLVENLQARIPGPGPSRPIQGWSSRPLTLCLMHIQSSGYSLQEGAAALLEGLIADRLIAQRRFGVVERGLLDSLMNELKLGSSQLADLQTALSLGRLVSARLILFGRLVHSAPCTQMTLRCVETETSKVTAVVNLTFDTQAALAGMADRIVDELTGKLQRQYPLRASVVEASGPQLVLDIGRRQGAVPGARLRAVAADLLVRITAVHADRSSARSIQGRPPTTVGLKLEEVPPTR